jgi:hypothetical protein
MFKSSLPFQSEKRHCPLWGQKAPPYSSGSGTLNLALIQGTEGTRGKTLSQSGKTHLTQDIKTLPLNFDKSCSAFMKMPIQTTLGVHASASTIKVGEKMLS